MRLAFLTLLTQACALQVFRYNGVACSLSKPRCSEGILDAVLAEKLGVDDAYSLGPDTISKLKDSTVPSELLDSSTNGHLVVSIKGDNLAQKQLERDMCFVCLSPGLYDQFEAQKKEFAQLLALERHFSVKMAESAVAVLSSSSAQNKQFGAYANYLASKNLEEADQLLLELRFLALQIVPEGAVVVDETDETFGFVSVDLDTIADQEARTVVMNNIVTLVRQALGHGIDSTIVYAPLQTMVSKRQFKPKQLSKQSVFGLEEECIFATNNCNTHGLCSKNTLTQKWLCLCSSTFNKTLKLTTHWSGSSCEKIDISAEFSLLFWLSFVMLGTVIGAIAMIFKMDQEPLPGILSAATSLSFKN